MIDKHGIIVECAYDQLGKTLNSYKTTFDKAKKAEFMMDAFKEFLNDIRR